MLKVNSGRLAPPRALLCPFSGFFLRQMRSRSALSKAFKGRRSSKPKSLKGGTTPGLASKHGSLSKGLQKSRENDWIRGGNFLNTDPKYYDVFHTLSDIKEADCLFRVDKVFKDDIEVALYALCKNAVAGNFKYQKYNMIFENFEYEPLMRTALRSFENKLYLALSIFFTATKVDLEDMLVPTVKDLPNLVKNIESPELLNYLKSLGLKTREEEVYYFFEHTLHQEYRSLKKNRTPPQSIRVDISNPAEWYPEARKIKRKIIMHVGPTNSGKTYNALKRLKESNSGYFAGPLRLLAREIYDRFQSENIRCNLVTGEEVIENLDKFGNKAPFSSGTVEMIDRNTYFDVVVLDEIQMMADENRGWAWTAALLGAQAKEVHLCGEERTVPLVKRILKSTGDELIIHTYERLGKLVVEEEPLHNNIRDLKRGDCIVVFSKKKILSYKMRIEQETKLKCGVIYGALPAEVRATEASKFNSGQYDVLIASDAIGMGLNLKINRVIFDSHQKFNGTKIVDIHPAHVKQVGGRAGRFKIAPKKQDLANKPLKKSKEEKMIEDIEVDLNDKEDASIGYVSAFSHQTLSYIKRCFGEEIEDIERAVIWPENDIWSHYVSEYPSGTQFSTIMKAFKEEVESTSSIYEAASIDDKIDGVAIFDTINRMLVVDKLKISNIPLNRQIGDYDFVVRNLGIQVANSETKTVLDFENMDFYSTLKQTVQASTDHLTNLEVLHKKLMAWSWMNNRYPTLFVDRETSDDLKTLTEVRIEEALETLRVEKQESRRKGKYVNKKFGKKK